MRRTVGRVARAHNEARDGGLRCGNVAISVSTLAFMTNTAYPLDSMTNFLRSVFCNATCISRRWLRVARTGSALLGLLGACTFDSFGPISARFDGVYALESVNNSPVPATAAQGGGEHYILLADTLAFSRDGTVSRSLVFRHLSTTFEPRDSIHQYRLTFPYTIDGGRVVTIGYREPCPPNASCVGYEVGMITPSRATIKGRLLWSGEPVLRFRRL